MTKTSSFESVSTKQQRIAELAKQNPTMALTSLNHHLDVAWLREAFQRTRKDGAPGVDGQTWAEYGENLEANLRSLLDRAKSGTYRAPPVRRVHIPKGTGAETRPIGIPTLEDKVLQRAVAMILEAIYERDFCDCSYGFRPGRSAHQALDSLWRQTMGSGGGWILDMDIRKFFDTLDHAHLREFLRQRVRDGVLLRLIGKWLKAGVMENGSISYPDSCSGRTWTTRTARTRTHANGLGVSGWFAASREIGARWSMAPSTGERRGRPKRAIWQRHGLTAISMAHGLASSLRRCRT